MPTTSTTFTSYNVYTNDEGTIAMRCTGYQVYEKQNEEWSLTLSGTANTYVMETMPTVETKFEWQYDTEVLVSAAESDNGSVLNTGFQTYGEECVLTAVANDGWHFAGWSGDVPAGKTSDNPLTLMPVEPMTLVPVFLPAGQNRPTQYVSTTGDDANTGLSWESARKTVLEAVSYIRQYEGLDGVVYVDSGTYAWKTPLVLDFDVSIVGAPRDGGEVILRNTTKQGWNNPDQRVLKINHAKAFVAGVSIENGSSGGPGGCVYIQENGGTVSNCVIRGGNSDSHNTDMPHGVGAYLDSADALLTHCVVSNCTTALDTWWATGGYLCGIGVDVNKGRVENCLIVDCHGKALPTYPNTVGGLRVVDGAVVNCTVINCNGSDAGGVRGTADTAFVTNCVAFGNVLLSPVFEYVDNQNGTITTNTVDAIRMPSGFVGNSAHFVRCASDAAFPELAENSVEGLTSAAFADYAAGDFSPMFEGPLCSTGVAIDGWNTQVDLSGRPRVRGKIDIGCFEFQPADGMLLLFR